MTWKTSFKVCAVILLVAAFVVGISSYVKRGARASVMQPAITGVVLPAGSDGPVLSREEIIAVANLQSQAQSLDADYKAKMATIQNQVIELRKRKGIPDDFVFDMQGNIIVGFRPETPEEKDKRAHSGQ